MCFLRQPWASRQAAFEASAARADEMVKLLQQGSGQAGSNHCAQIGEGGRDVADVGGPLSYRAGQCGLPRSRRGGQV